MTEHGTIELLKECPRLLQTVYKDLAQPGIRQVGMALETVLGLSNTLLLPLKLLNDKTRALFTQRMDEYRRKLMMLPEQAIADVPTEIGIPLLERFTFVTDEEIANLFVTLLASASCKTTEAKAHPSFIHLIDNICPDEARLFQHLAKACLGEIPFLIIRTKYGKRHKQTLTQSRPLTGLEFDVNLQFARNINIYLDNMISLGVIDTDWRPLKNLANRAILERKYKDLIFDAKDERRWFNLDEGVTGRDAPKVVAEGYWYAVTAYGTLFINNCTHRENKTGGKPSVGS